MDDLDPISPFVVAAVARELSNETIIRYVERRNGTLTRKFTPGPGEFCLIDQFRVEIIEQILLSRLFDPGDTAF